MVHCQEAQQTINTIKSRLLHLHSVPQPPGYPGYATPSDKDLENQRSRLVMCSMVVSLRKALVRGLAHAAKGSKPLDVRVRRLHSEVNYWVRAVLGGCCIATYNLFNTRICHL